MSSYATCCFHRSPDPLCHSSRSPPCSMLITPSSKIVSPPPPPLLLHLSSAKNIMTDVFGSALPHIVGGGFAAGYVAALSGINMTGRTARCRCTAVEEAAATSSRSPRPLRPSPRRSPRLGCSVGLPRPEEHILFVWPWHSYPGQPALVDELPGLQVRCRGGPVGCCGGRQRLAPLLPLRPPRLLRFLAPIPCPSSHRPSSALDTTNCSPGTVPLYAFCGGTALVLSFYGGVFSGALAAAHVGSAGAPAYLYFFFFLLLLLVPPLAHLALPRGSQSCRRTLRTFSARSTSAPFTVAS